MNDPRLYLLCLLSFWGLYGVRQKRSWGPALCAAGSFAWFFVAWLSRNNAYATVELGYCLFNAAIALKWLDSED